MNNFVKKQGSSLCKIKKKKSFHKTKNFKEIKKRELMHAYKLLKLIYSSVDMELYP